MLESVFWAKARLGGKHGMFEELGEVAKVAEEQRARSSKTTDKGLAGTQRGLVFLQRSVGHHCWV